MAEKKRYNKMELTLQNIEKKYISLNEDETKRNVRIMEAILNQIVQKMRDVNPLFKKMYRRVFYGGSFYDGLRVGKAEEFDLDLLLDIPVYAQPKLTSSKDAPGFVTVKLDNYDGFAKQPEAHLYPNFHTLFDDERYLHSRQTLKWMEGVLQKALNEFPPSEGNNSVKCFKACNEGPFLITFRKGGPALTLQIERKGDRNFKMDVDLVPCFVFSGNKWPEGFKSNPVSKRPEFFIVPKEPKGADVKAPERFWRLSFQEQERELMNGRNNLKPTIKFLKKLRDTQGHKPIASYFIKTSVLWLSDEDSSFGKNSKSYDFMTGLKKYQQFIEGKSIPYFWKPENNLLGKIGRENLGNMNNRLTSIINNIERNLDDPNVVAKYLLTPEELNEFLSNSA